jgi:hypothetical protein
METRAGCVSIYSKAMSVGRVRALILNDGMHVTNASKKFTICNTCVSVHAYSGRGRSKTLLGRTYKDIALLN